MNKYPIIIGVTLIGLSFYSIGPVLCDELLQNACYRIHGTEHYFTVLPIFSGMLGVGLILVIMGFKSISLMSFSKS